jgi:hypothetical protein
MPKVNKPVKKASVIIEEVVEEESEEIGIEAPPVELDADLAFLQKKAIKRRREAARLAGYRKLAASTGISKDSARGIVKPLLSLADTRRILSFVPDVYKFGSVEPDEAKLRIDQHAVLISTAACNVFRGLLESEIRKVGVEAVNMAASLGRTRVDAAMLNHILSSRQVDFFNSSEVPLGLIRHAQTTGILGLLEDEAESLDAEKASNKQLSKLYAASAKEVTDAKLARKARTLQKSEAKSALEQVAEEEEEEPAKKGIMAGGKTKKFKKSKA